MSLSTQQSTKLNIRELCELAILGAICFAGKLLCASLPNIHPVTMLIIAITIVYGTKALYSVAVYIGLEFLVNGLGLWSISYLYIWPLLVFIVLLFKSKKSRLCWIIIAALHGFLFGLLCSVPYFISGDMTFGLAYIASGISFDLIHGISNAVICFFLINPVTKLISDCHRKKL